jgi:hypothetical protein
MPGINKLSPQAALWINLPIKLPHFVQQLLPVPALSCELKDYRAGIEIVFNKT